MEDSTESLNTQIANAVADLKLKSETLAHLSDLARRASREEMDAINRINEAQKKFDELVAMVKKSAPHNTDWKRTTGITV